MWLKVSWALHRLCNCHRSASLRSYVDGVWLSVWSRAATIKISVSPLSPALLNQAQLASLSTKGFSRSSSVLSFSKLSFSITSLVFELLTKANIYFLLPLLPSGENILPSQPHFLKACKTCLCPAQHNHSN